MKIGITEAGDAGLDLSWEAKMDSVDAAVVITKKLTPDCRAALMRHQGRVILHNTITGYGNTVLEPNVWDCRTSLRVLRDFCEKDGFPKRQVVVRIDPIVPTDKGLRRAEFVLRAALALGFTRFRVSVIDMYPHVRERFKKAGVPLPYYDHFSPTPAMMNAVDRMLEEVWWDFPNISIEACSEQLLNVLPGGCVSGKDLDILGIPHGGLDDLGPQRSGCRCFSGKTELLGGKVRCGNQCLYCYWRD